MKFYFDESGQFRIPGKTEARLSVSVVVGLAVSGQHEKDFFRDITQFIKQLPSEFKSKGGEMKGRLLTRARDRHDFCAILRDYRKKGSCPING